MLNPHKHIPSETGGKSGYFSGVGEILEDIGSLGYLPRVYGQNHWDVIYVDLLNVFKCRSWNLMKLAAHQFKTRETFPYDPCMVSLPTITIKINQMSVYIPYMECLGLLFCFNVSFFGKWSPNWPLKNHSPALVSLIQSMYYPPRNQQTSPLKINAWKTIRLPFGGVKRPIFRGVSWLLGSGRAIYI